MLEPLRASDPRHVGSYRLLARLPSGGMADVYLGLEQRGQVFVVKVAGADPSGLLAEQFLNEIRTARRAHGRYIAEIVGMDPHADPSWLATQYVPGPSLLEVVRADGPLPESSVLALAAGLADALMCIHASNVMHGDLTPGNVLLLPDGPRVIDFGISGLIEATTTLAFDAPRFGTLGYIAPERLGPVPTRATTASDVYSLGAVLWFASTAQRPPEYPSGAPQVDHLPARLRPLVASCMAADPGQRPEPAQIVRRVLPAGTSVATAFAGGWLPPAAQARIDGRVAELRRLLDSVAAEQSRTRQIMPDSTTAGPGRRTRAPAIAALVLAALAAGAAVTYISQRDVGGGSAGAPSGRQSSAATPVSASAASAASTDAYPCTFESRPAPLDQLPYRCPLVWDHSTTLTAIPVFATYDIPGLVAADRIDQLVKGPAPQYFKCHIEGAYFGFPAQAGLPAARHAWWAYTQGDGDRWGFVPEAYLLGGDDDAPDPGLARVCTLQDIAREGA